MNTKNKYYLNQEKTINNLILEKNFAEAIKIINEELSMPYIPSSFEKFLIEKINEIPQKSERISLSVSKIIDILLKLDNTKKDVKDLINNLNKFNLNNEIDELLYFFENAKNDRNMSLLFELLIEQNINIDTKIGNPSNSISINEIEEFKKDKKIIEKKLEKFPEYIEIIINILKEIYLLIHVGKKIDNSYFDVAIYVGGKIFNNDKILKLVNNLEEIERKIKNLDLL